MNYKNVIRLSIFILFSGLMFSFSSCSDDTVTAPPVTVVVPEPDMSSYMKIDSGYVLGASAYMNLYANDSLRTGYNPLYFVLHDSATGIVMTDAHITIQPLNHGHASPVENPDEDAPDGIFEGAMSDSTALYLSNITPYTPVPGLNNFEFLISKNEPELYPPDGSYTIEMNPVYLADGHSTTGNVTPVGSANGHYNGKINFDQSGTWRINLMISKNGHSYSTYFDMSY